MDLAGRARGALERAAIRAQQRADGPPRTTREDLAAWAQAHLQGRRLVIVSNREPYSHRAEAAGAHVVRNAGGLTVALDAVMQSLGGTWVAHGAVGPDGQARVPCPPGRPRYTLRRVPLGERDHVHYYSGFANSALWPLCHIVHVRPRFRLDDWECYRDVNRRFAEAALEEIGDGPALVFIQDYHLALAARYMREARPDLQLALFWHIPWPNPEIFRILPWREELLEGMLANDVIGFHIPRHALNFADTVADTLEARVDPERMAIDRGGRRSWVRAFPISVDADEIAALAEASATKRAEEELRERLGLQGCRIGLGVDRLDYTKGIVERFEALERFLEKHGEWRGRFAFLQVGVPSRIELPEYRAVRSRVRRAVERLNGRFPRPGGPTVHLIEAQLDFRDLVPYYRIADFCCVTSLHDGMNLVAKEYVAASPDLEGALILSPYTGASRELERAWVVSPYDREALADAFAAVLAEPPAARAARMAALRETVLRRNIFDWMLEVLDSIVSFDLRTRVREPEEPARPRPDDGNPEPEVRRW